MIRLTEKIKAQIFTDDFDDGILSPELYTTGDGTTVEAAGVLTLAIAAGAGTRYQIAAPLRLYGKFKASFDVSAYAFDVLAGDTHFCGLTTLLFDDAEGDTFANIAIAWEGAPMALKIVAVVSVDGVIVDQTEAAIPGLPLRFWTERDGASVSLGYFYEGTKTTLLSSTNFSAGRVSVAAFLETKEETAGASMSIDNFIAEPEFQIAEISDLVYGCNLHNRIVIDGKGFSSEMLATVGGESAEIQSVTSTRVVLKGPLVAADGMKTLTLTWGEVDFGGGDLFTGHDLSTSLRYSSAGYRELMKLHPPGRYGDDTTNPRNVFVALIGQELDRFHYAALDLVAKEIHPDLSQYLIAEHEKTYGIAPNPNDDLATRRARVMIRRAARPSIACDALNTIIQTVLAGVEVTENAPFSVHGRLKWQFQIYEPASGTLDQTTHGELLQALSKRCAAFARPAIGAQGFYLGSSRMGRDFLRGEKA